MGDDALAAYAVGFATGMAVTALAVSYHHLWRDRMTTWGATAAETTADLPGDELSPRSDLVTTRAVAISAPPSCVWPWLAQMGSGRAGHYSYDWIENLLGLDIHSAEVILPQFQNIVPGDEFPIGGRPGVMRVELMEPEQNLTLESWGGKHRPHCEARWISTFALLPQPGAATQPGPTRLVNGNRISLPHLSPALRRICTLLLEPCGFFLERKMLLGIKERAERLPSEREFALTPPDHFPSHLWHGEQL
jgi:hypothetical protein